MNNTIIFDPIGGASGDMIVGALIDAGADFDKLSNGLKQLNMDEFRVEARKITTYLISATKFDVIENSNLHSHRGHHHGRKLADIRKLIEYSSLSEAVKSKAISVFLKLGEAEAKVHNTTLEKVHFHEVGAVDSIVDIVSACICLEILGIEFIYVGKLPLSRGFIDCEHGQWPVPGPATLEITKGFQWVTVDVDGELVTPTAAAILTTLGKPLPDGLQITLNCTGYGAGTKDYGIPNVLRVNLGELTEKNLNHPEHNSDVVVIQTCLDDEIPEMLDFVMGKLFENGALDVWFTPVQMKKNRPGIELTALAESSDIDKLSEIVLLQTSTLGIRYWYVKRKCLPRRTHTVSTRYGDVRIKVGILPDGRTKPAPEYEDVKLLANKNNALIKDVYREALDQYLQDEQG